ncbi:MAG TPA: hypothetical protein VGM16_10960 [Gammaproteobacteria bacterium]|jgi:hypothetical protein
MRIVSAFFAVLLLSACASGNRHASNVDPAMASFEAELKGSLTQQTVGELRKISKFQSGFVYSQFHYQDGKILDASVVYLAGRKDLAQAVTDQLLRAQVPPAIPEIAGKRIRFLLGFCFFPSPADCDEYKKRANAAVPPETVP